MAIYQILLTLLFIALPSILLLLLRSSYRTSKGAKHTLPPGPKKLPIIGNLHQILGPHPHQIFYNLSQKHGPLMFLQLGSIPSVVVSSSEMAREVLKTHDLDLCSRPRLVATDKYSYSSVDVSFSPYGEYWREMRKLFTVELFGAKRAPIFRAIREDEMSKMIEAISRSSSSSSSAPINLSKTMVDLANNIICRVALGKKYQEREAEDGKLQKIFNELQLMLCAFYVKDYFPSMGWIDKLRGLIGRLERNVRELDAFYEQLILEHAGRESTARSDQEDVVDALLRLSRDNKEHLTNDNIKALISVCSTRLINYRFASTCRKLSM